MKIYLCIITLVMLFSILYDGGGFVQSQQKEETRTVEVRIVGNKHVDKGTILDRIRTARGRPFSTAQVQEDRRAILSLGLFSEVDVEITRTRQKVVVTFKVVENETVKEIVVKGNTVVSSAEILKVLTTKANEILGYRKIENDVELIADLYRQKGYIGRVADADLDSKTGRLTLTIIEGVIEKLTLTFFTKIGEDGEIIPTDKHETDPEVIWREVKVKERDLVNTNRLREDVNRLLGLNIFADVRHRLKSGSESGKVIVDFQIREHPRSTSEGKEI